ncbi:hypothetical protein ES708_20692 [subsurface metagenome]
MAGKGHALARDELIRVLTVYTGATTGIGAADGSTLVDSNLIGVNDFVTNKTILIMSGNARYETKQAIVFNPVTGGIAVNPPFSAQITTGTLFRIINLSAGSSLAIVIGAVTAIFDLVNAMLVLTETGGTVTTTGGEDDVYINNAPAGVYEPRKVMIDLTPMTDTETVAIKTYYRIKFEGDLILKDTVTFTGVQDEPLKNVELEPNRFGVRVSIQRTAGDDLAYDWEALYKA